MNRIPLKSTFSLLNVDHVKLNKSWNYKNVISPFYRLYFIGEGRGKLSNPNESARLEKGYLYLIPSFTICNYTCEESLDQYYIHIIEESPNGASLFLLNRKILKVQASQIDIQNFKRLLTINPGRGLKDISNNPEVYEKQPIIQRFQELNNQLPLSSFAETQGIILQLLSRFLTVSCFGTGEVNAIPSKISDTINYIQSNIKDNLTVAHLAERVNQSPDYFSRIFQTYTGERPLSYVQLKRIERAQFLMITTNLPLQEIASETGFESLSYFSRIFKRLTQQTAGDYRKNHQVF